MIPQVSLLPEFHAAFTIEWLLLVVYRFVPDNLPLDRERFAADLAGESFDARVRGLVVGQPLLAPEMLVAVGALVWLVIRVHAIVNVNGIQRAKGFRAMFARVRSFPRVNPPMVIFGAFVRERAAADIAGVLLQPFVNVPHVPGQVLLDSIRLPAYVALARPLVGMNANVTQKAPLREYNFLTSDALVGDPSVDRLLRFIQQFHFVGILDPVHVRVPAYVLLQFGLFRETSAAQVASEGLFCLVSGSFLGT